MKLLSTDTRNSLLHTLQSNRALLAGTFLLTGAGIISRFLGFFYRIFLSRTFGAEGMGLYQLVTPVLALSFAICCSGIQTAISRFTASESKKKSYRHSYHILTTGLFLSLLLSILCSLILLRYCVPISHNLLHEPRCEPLVRIVAIAIPFAAIHSCINGYYYSLRNAKLPALSQLLEQIVRIGSVYLLYRYSLSHDASLEISVAVIGMLAGEIASSVLSILVVSIRFHGLLPLDHTVLEVKKVRTLPGSHTIAILRMAFPLSASRVVVNLLASMEAVYIPLSLIQYGLLRDEALAQYGILSGMALPLILFPGALTNSFSVLLLPMIAEAQADADYPKIKRTLQKTTGLSIVLGLFFCVIFLLTGSFAGRFFFHSSSAGTYIALLSFLCPFLYLSTTMSSILHGLGRTWITCFINVTALLIRLTAVWVFVPLYGMLSYITGLLLSQLFCAAVSYLCVVRTLRRKMPC